MPVEPVLSAITPISPVTLHDVHRYFESVVIDGKSCPIVGNEDIRIAAVLAWGQAGMSVIVRGESGSAKTKIMKAIVTLLYGTAATETGTDDVFLLDSGADKAMLHQAVSRRLQRARRVYIPELQNVKNQEAMLKKWTEGSPYIYERTVNLKDEFNPTERVVLPPKPILTALADGNESMEDLSNEMQRRWVQLFTKSDESVNVKVHKNKARRRYCAQTELEPLAAETQTAIANRVRAASLDRRRVVNRCAKYARLSIPSKYTISNTFIDYYLDFIEAVAKFYAPERPCNEDVILATPEDNYVASKILAPTIRDLSIGIYPGIGELVLSTLPICSGWGDMAVDNKRDRKHIDEIVDALDAAGVPRQKKVVADILERLVGAGFAAQDEKKLFYKTSDRIQAMHTVLDWDKIITDSEAWVQDKYPELADAYLRQSRTYTDPFTGEVLPIVPITPSDMTVSPTTAVEPPDFLKKLKRDF